MNVQSPSDLRAIRAGSGLGETNYALRWLLHFALYGLTGVLTYVLSRSLNVPESRIVGAQFALLACFTGIEMMQDGKRKRRPELVFAGSVLLFAPAIGLEIATFFARWH